MKLFLTWLTIQLIFARVLFGLSVELWKSLHLAGSEALGYFLIPVLIICLSETVVSGVIVYDLVMIPIKHAHDLALAELRIKNPNTRF